MSWNLKVHGPSLTSWLESPLPDPGILKVSASVSASLVIFGEPTVVTQLSEMSAAHATSGGPLCSEGLLLVVVGEWRALASSTCLAVIWIPISRAIGRMIRSMTSLGVRSEERRVGK